MKRHLKLASLAFAVFLIACFGEKAINILITTCNVAPIAVAQINTSQENKDRLNKGFAKEATILTLLKKTPEDQEAQKKAALDTGDNIHENFVKINNPQADAWIGAIIQMLREFFGIPEGGEFSRPSIERALQNNSINITEEKAKEFQRLVEGGPQR